MKLSTTTIVLALLIDRFRSSQAHAGVEATLQYHLASFSDNSSDLPFINEFTGFVTYMSAKPLRCFGVDAEEEFDVAILGAPFDTATTYRPGARFGPNGIRQGSRRINVAYFDPFMKMAVADHINIVDCGDVPMVYVDNKAALRQLEQAGRSIVSKEAKRIPEGVSLAKDGKFHKRILTLGGDHTITLPLLRSIAEVYGPVTIIHFDSHVDTWRPGRFDTGPRLPGEDIPVNHATYFWFAHKEGLLANDTNIHVGIRGAALETDLESDRKCGFSIIHADEIEDIGYAGVIQAIKDRVGDNPVYISIDIDVIDPGMAPAPEIGGYTTREMKKILKGLEGLKIVGADIVEVAPAYDTQDEITQIAAANIGWMILGLMAKTPLTV
ncbi:hypothetical protein M422DRAFT_179332 [Sphaerobolus stellatus SS14]|uniref:Agmatinase n=1 Tax=Sphaerobolus stellatus (strain SS14) TaxID=990650 RepID=A0A0C9VGT0_SPHS4|nr:hypothetical protein M422DRAFT_179332 [Sphaerobolus stellatus SS14]